jgi:hypothetical protein
MSKNIFLICCLLSFVPKSFSQVNLSDYSYVIVPEQFELMNEKDKYQLNSLAEFLFNKHGFHAFKSESAPNARRCDGLYADLIRIPVLLKTKLVIVLKDCNNKEVYRTGEGVSKFKEFKKAYQDAMRKAFESFDDLYVNQKPIAVFKEDTPNPVGVEVNSEIDEPKVSTPVVSNVDEVVNSETSSVKLPEARFSSYSFKNSSYLLRKTTEGYSLYEESTDSENGLLLIGKLEATGETQLIFTDAADQIFKASFDASENLIIQKGNTQDVYKRLR